MLIRHLSKVLPQSLCLELLEFASQQSFEAASVNYYGETQRKEAIRNNDRLEWDNADLAKRLEHYLLIAMGDEFPTHLDCMHYVATGSHFRFYRYRPGQYFKPHRDGSYQAAECESLVTVLFYLNDADGGETLVMPYGPRERWAHQAFVPRTGDALLFEHRVWHEGCPVHSGEKYVLRTDLFYRS